MLRLFRYRALGRWGLLFVAGVATIGLCGCGSNKPEAGDRKQDWVKTAPPPQWRGPGQPGGPPANAASGPASQPPTGAPTGGTGTGG